ncbi:sensor histidine kinase [Streptosporangium carneum]|uniref:histidine kinase n=1 Tax=Streptosporangium carneum TaxID=47481 RepID=A0A9W6I7E3_9ACTN|nr:histidine kinase [Streptosporangium carneum]GLK12554.1 two-component sensor histidine kinase [Streptosporangium carneum]
MIDSAGRLAGGSGPQSRRRRALTWQSMGVVLICVLADVGMFVLTRPVSGPGYAIVLAGTVAADLLLAAPVRWTREIAIVHAAVAAITPMLLPSGPEPAQANNAGLIVAAFLAGAWLRSWPAVEALGALVIGLMVNQMVTAVGAWPERAVVTLTSCMLPWLVGRVTMARRAYVADLERHADHLRRDRQAAVRRAVARERGTIARDLHDVISHHVSTIGIHAGAARRELAGRDEAATRSLAAVESASRSAMLDLRRLLDVLHGETPASGDRQPGIASVDELLDGVRSAGIPVRLATDGRGGELPGSVDVAVYRTLQEALTNAVRHGDGTGVDVELRYRPQEFTVTVTNGTPARVERPDEGRARRGLAGVRQRVILLGGTVRYGQADGRSWRLEAGFPLEET